MPPYCRNFFASLLHVWKRIPIFATAKRRLPSTAPARMAESVDALVSNTNDSNVVPVRPRLRVLLENLKWFISNHLRFLLYSACPQFVRILCAIENFFKKVWITEMISFTEKEQEPDSIKINLTSWIAQGALSSAASRASRFRAGKRRLRYGRDAVDDTFHA